MMEERLGDVLKEIGPLLAIHHDEISLLKLEINPNVQLYERLEALNALRIFTYRVDGVLKGYATFFVGPHPHFQHSKQATNDMLFIHPEYRGRGMQFMKWCDGQLQDCDVIYWSVTTRCDFSNLLKRMGYEESETRYVRRNR